MMTQNQQDQVVVDTYESSGMISLKERDVLE